jgi:predicted nucleotidyltransferase
MLAGYADPPSLVRDALIDVTGIQAAFVFGSIAKATHRKDSDVDVFVVEDEAVDRKALYRQLAEVGLLLGREVNTVRYTAQALAERLGNRDHAASQFVREVLKGPKRWVAGAAAAIQPIATAAGVSMAEFSGAPA